MLPKKKQYKCYFKAITERETNGGDISNASLNGLKVTENSIKRFF